MTLTRFPPLSRRYSHDIISAGNNYNRVRKAICSGYFRNAAKKDAIEGYKTLTEGTPVFLHPSSSMFQRPPEWCIYNEIIMTTKEYMHCILAIEPKWLSEVAPYVILPRSRCPYAPLTPVSLSTHMQCLLQGRRCEQDLEEEEAGEDRASVRQGTSARSSDVSLLGQSADIFLSSLHVHSTRSRTSGVSREPRRRRGPVRRSVSRPSSWVQSRVRYCISLLSQCL
jgi:hypothetical protein